MHRAKNRSLIANGRANDAEPEADVCGAKNRSLIANARANDTEHGS